MIHDFLFMQSSMLSGCSYDDEKRELTVTFSNSKNYVYEDVDKSIYDALISAESAGRYFNSVKAHLKVKK